jgi:nicotinate-nucleotide adenylyltransferase
MVRLPRHRPPVHANLAWVVVLCGGLRRAAPHGLSGRDQRGDSIRDGDPSAGQMKAGFPPVGAGQRVGLLGGSFDPPHAGHVHLTRQALRAFGLDHVWWLVSPGNPLKREGPAPLDRRMAAARRIMRHPRVQITDAEARLGTQVTADTLEALIALYPWVRFTWLMGADNLATIHRWERWPEIFARVPVGVISRPGDPIWARTAHAARLFRDHRLRAPAAPLLGRATPPAWCYLRGPQIDVSSTAIRARGGWAR